MNARDNKTTFQTVLPNINASKPSDNSRLLLHIPDYPGAILFANWHIAY
jgi:hypothetical protein